MIRRGFLKAVAAVGTAGFAIPEVSAEEATEALKNDGYRTVLLFRVRQGSGLSPGASAAHALQMSSLRAEDEEFRKDPGRYRVGRLPGELSAEDDVWELRRYESEDFRPFEGFPRVGEGLA